MNTIALTRCSLRLPNHGNQILSGLSVRLSSGRITWLVGESGAGKSTLCNLLAGLTPARAAVSGHLDMGAGRIDVGTRRGRKLLAGLRRRGDLTWAPQNAMDTFPPRQRLREWFQRAGIEHPELSCFGLENSMLERYPHELSGGQISRVSLAAALSHTPQLLVCDEPTAGLDPKQADSMVSLLDDSARTGGAAVLAVTHDLSVMARNARPDDNVAVIFNGHIVDACTVESFLGIRAENAYSRALAAAAPVAGAHPLPLSRSHLGGRGYRQGDELRRLESAHTPALDDAAEADEGLQATERAHLARSNGLPLMRGDDDGAA